MKKKIITLVLTLGLTLALAVSASAYSQYATATITRDGVHLSFAGTMNTNASGPYVSHIQANQHVYNFATGKTIFDRSNSGSKVSSIRVACSTGNIMNYWYCNDVHGLVQYAGDSTYYHDDAYKELNLMGRSGLYSDTSYNLLYNTHKANRDSILTSFGYNPQDYTFYLNADAKSIMNSDAYVNMRHQLNLEEGDSIPGYYLNKDKDRIIAVNQTNDGENHMYVFEISEDGNWAKVG